MNSHVNVSIHYMTMWKGVDRKNDKLLEEINTEPLEVQVYPFHCITKQCISLLHDKR